MPLVNSLNVNSSNLLLWRINESEEELNKDLNLSDFFKSRLGSIKATSRRKQSLSIHHLLKSSKINQEFFYDYNGKPKLSNNKFISISHSFDYSGVAISNNKVGVDIEKFRPKILDISKKFISQTEQDLIKELDIENLTKVWTIKEAVYKAFGYQGIDFKENILIENINNEFNKVQVKINKNEIIENYNVDIINFSQYICSVANHIKNKSL
jgi:phosphopantetheinyl transferase